MGLFDIFRGNSLEKQVLAFYETNSDLTSIRTAAQMLDFFSRHPGWKQLPQDVLQELSTRIADKSRKWVVYDSDHAFEILVFMTEKSNALVHNFIPICRDIKSADTPEAKLYIFAMTFEKLASKYIREMSEQRDRLPERKVADGLEDAKAFAEASLICDRYFVTSFMPSAWGWVLKNDDSAKAVAILDEGIRWVKEMGTARPHKASLFDEQFINDTGEQVKYLEDTKQCILEKREPTP